MRNKDQPVGIRDQSIARDPRLLLICPGESSVDDHNLAVTLDRALSVLALDRHMPVDDMRPFRRKPEFLKDPVHHLLLLEKAVIWILLLLVRLLLCKEIPLKRRHLILAEKRRPFAEPDIPHHIPAALPLLWVQRMETLPYIALQDLIQTLSLIRMPVDAHGLKASVRIKRHTAMVQEIIVIDLI